MVGGGALAVMALIPPTIPSTSMVDAVAFSGTVMPVASGIIGASSGCGLGVEAGCEVVRV